MNPFNDKEAFKLYAFSFEVLILVVIEIQKTIFLKMKFLIKEKSKFNHYHFLNSFATQTFFCKNDFSCEIKKITKNTKITFNFYFLSTFIF